MKKMSVSIEEKNDFCEFREIGPKAVTGRVIFEVKSHPRGNPEGVPTK